MTDRYQGFLVVLESDIREDDAQATISAIEQIKGVLQVTPVLGSIMDTIAQERARGELFGKILDMCKPLTRADRWRGGESHAL